MEMKEGVTRAQKAGTREEKNFYSRIRRIATALAGLVVIILVIGLVKNQVDESNGIEGLILSSNTETEVDTTVVVHYNWEYCAADNLGRRECYPTQNVVATDTEVYFEPIVSYQGRTLNGTWNYYYNFDDVEGRWSRDETEFFEADSGSLVLMKEDDGTYKGRKRANGEWKDVVFRYRRH